MLVELRWGNGRAVYPCNRCQRQLGLTAGSVVHWTIDRSAVDPGPQGRAPAAREGGRSPPGFWRSTS